MADARDREQVNVRLDAEDVVVLDWLIGYITGMVGRGVLVQKSDAVRWALHTAKAGLEAECESTSTHKS